MLRLDPGETMGGEAVKDEEDSDEEEADDFLVADAAAGDEQRPPERRRGRGREEKERTKARERRRRAVTGRILAGLRRHGGFGLRSRADVNEVVAALARHAGWVVLPDGTTFPSHPHPHPQILRCLPDEAISPMVRDGFENQFCSGKDVVAATASSSGSVVVTTFALA